MSNIDPDEFEQQQESGGIAALRAAAAAGKAASDKNVLLEKKVAFMEAGISPLTEIGGMLFDTWDGQNIDELKAKAVRLGVLKAEGTPDPAPEVEKSAEEIEALNRIEQENRERQSMQERLGGGGQAAGHAQEGPNPMDAVLEQFQLDRKRGVDEQVAQRDAVAKILTAGHVEFDRRLIYDHDEHLARGREADLEFEGGVTGR